MPALSSQPEKDSDPSHHSSPKIRFGTDGWRGVIARDFTQENVILVARAIASYLNNPEDTHRGVIVAYDTRFLADRFARIVAEVLTSIGTRVDLATSPTPTPALSFAVRSRGAAAGVMLTASHNPAEWLGIKIKAAFGGSAPPDMVKKVEELLSDPASLPLFEPDEKLIHMVDMKPAYLSRLSALVDLEAIARARIKRQPLRFAIDPMHGAGAGYLGELFTQHKIEFVEVRGRRDPLFGGSQPEPIEQHLTPLREAIAKHHCAAGFATDGDADRIGAMDENGVYVDPHRIFALLLRHLVEHRGLTGGVVKTFSVSKMIDRIAKHYGLPLTEVPIGFKHIAELMLQENILIGGEESGGIGFREHLPERDGLLNTLLLAELLAKEGKPLSRCVTTLQEQFGPLHYKRKDFILTEGDQQRIRAFLEGRKFSQVGDWAVSGREDLDGIKLFLKDTGWVLIRLSGTEPVIRIYAEGTSVKLVDQYVTSIISLLPIDL
jgi:phosphomannomutase